METLQGMKTRARATGCAILLICLQLFTQNIYAKEYSIAVLSSGHGPIYTDIVKIIRSEVNKNDSDVAFTTLVVGDEAIAESIKKADLLVTIGRRAMLNASQHGATPPIIASLVPRQAFEKNLSALKSVNKRVAAIYIDSPPERQILLSKLLLGRQQTVGILLSSAAIPGQEKIAMLLNKAGLKYQIEVRSNEDDLARELSRLLLRSDSLLALPDPLIFNRNTARNILLTTYRQRKPVIGFSANYVKAGALAAAFSTPGQIARQAGETIKRIMQSPNTFQFTGTYPNDFDIAINANVARSLSISIPPLDQLKEQLKAALEAFQ